MSNKYYRICVDENQKMKIVSKDNVLAELFEEIDNLSDEIHILLARIENLFDSKDYVKF